MSDSDKDKEFLIWSNTSSSSEFKQLLLENKLDVCAEDIKEIRESLKGSYVTHDQFAPVKMVIYGLVSIILTSVIGMILMLALNRK